MWKRKGKKEDADSTLVREKRVLLERISKLESSTGEERSQHAKETQCILLGIVEAVDAFDRVFASIRAKSEDLSEQTKIWVGNFRTVRRLLQRVLSDHNVLPIDDLQEGFDPERHQIFETKETSEPDGTILEEVHKGYTWRGVVLRKSQVVVACELEKTEHAETPTNEAVESAKYDGEPPGATNTPSVPTDDGAQEA